MASILKPFDQVCGKMLNHIKIKCLHTKMVSLELLCWVRGVEGCYRGRGGVPRQGREGKKGHTYQ